MPAADTPSRLDPDDHLVEPETRFEVFQGERVYVSPSRPGHGDLHSRLDGVVGEHVATAYTTSVNLLTRRSDNNDFATDVSVRRDGLDPATGHRYLEELSFEIFFQESREYARTRARNVVTYGVRRMFGIFVKERWPGSDAVGMLDYTVAEWSAERDDWRTLAPSEVIEDPALRLPIPVEALTSVVASRRAKARALLAGNDPVIQEHDARVRSEERLTATRESIFDVLEHRKIALDVAQRARIEACDDIATLKRWLLHTTDVRNAAELLA